MTPGVLSLARLSGRTGRGVRVAVVDSGVHAGHPHVGDVAAGIGFAPDGRSTPDFADRLGHGTAVAAAIREKAPAAELIAVRVFDRSLSSTGQAIVAAIDWAADAGATFINLSLGTANQAYAPEFRAAIDRAASRGSVVVAAAPAGGIAWLPGALAGVVAVDLDWSCPRDRCVVSMASGNHPRLSASGYPRPIPGVPPERNLRGQSFSVANATGLLALFVEGRAVRSVADLSILLGSL